ncbi:zinc-finger domain-containing protein [Mitosporidium daphniae]|uniref:Zinc-finger domain-containing protein n=1 Tax=Mitosporidium daphniae TaxID=1485682 RepID=A0A098VSQ4_9MICR|nr:zinc-finger domain-containing protein [Mitosporidium daphniae]KGG50751.1 zinc-finger domain-containing protein [Mitosporidium daphniae]|eukprot:XP_013237193.1 zinc-finger domain-containing protein [Mitosporidium daphniae]
MVEWSKTSGSGPDLRKWARIPLEDSALLKDHYRTEWHKYNLHRKISSLPPLSSEEYHQRLQVSQLSSSSPPVSKGVACQFCDGKHGEIIEAEQTPFENAIIKKMESLSISTFEQLFAEFPDITDTVMQDLRAQFSNLILPSGCLFCTSSFKDVRDNLDHMVEMHCFFIPQVENIFDFEGLVSHLAEKINFYRTCLCCHPEKRYRSVEALRKHMIDKGHTMLGDDLEDISRFYVFDEDEFEDLDEELGDENGQNQLQLKDEYEMELPSGRRVGHRKYRRYYSQYLRDSSETSESGQIETARGRTLAKEYKPLPIASDQQSIKDQRKFVQSLSRKMLKVSVNQNKFQPYFREQIL